jgi:hypothetical protein
VGSCVGPKTLFETTTTPIWKKIPLQLYAASQAVKDMYLSLNLNIVTHAEFVNKASCNKADNERRSRRWQELQTCLQGENALRRIAQWRERDPPDRQGLKIVPLLMTKKTTMTGCHFGTLRRL